MLFYFFAQSTNIKTQVPSLRETGFDKLITNFVNGNPNLPKFNIEGFEQLRCSLPWPLNQEFENAIYKNLSVRLNQEYKPFQGMHTYHKNIISICMSADNQFILTGGDDSYLNIWRFNINEQKYEHFQAFEGHNIRTNPARISFIEISNNNEFIVTGSPDDNTVNVWRFDGEKFQYFLPLKHPNTISAATISPDGTKVLAGCKDQPFIYLWNLNKDEFQKPITLEHPTESYIWNFNPKTYSTVFEGIHEKQNVISNRFDEVDEIIERLDSCSIHTNQMNLTKLTEIKNSFLREVDPTQRNTTYTNFASDKSMMIAGNFNMPLTICQFTKKGFIVSQRLECLSTVGTVSINTEFIASARGSEINIVRKTTPKLEPNVIDLFSFLKDKQQEVQ